MGTRHWSWAVVLLAATGFAVPAAAQVPLEPARLGVTVTAGPWRASATRVRALYPGTFVPVAIEADLRLQGRLFVFGGGQFIRQGGEIVLVQPPVPEERLPLKLKMSSARAGAGAAFPWNRWVFLAAGGVSYVQFEERWTGEDIPPVSGSSVGLILLGGVEYRVSRRFSAVWRIEYARTPVDKALQAVSTFDLSGLAVTGGIGVRF